jgi:hypothetical protein
MLISDISWFLRHNRSSAIHPDNISDSWKISGDETQGLSQALLSDVNNYSLRMSTDW